MEEQDQEPNVVIREKPGLVKMNGMKNQFEDDKNDAPKDFLLGSLAVKTESTPRLLGDHSASPLVQKLSRVQKKRVRLTEENHAFLSDAALSSSANFRPESRVKVEDGKRGGRLKREVTERREQSMHRDIRPEDVKVEED